MKRLLLLMLLSLVGTSVSAAEDCFDRIAQKKGLDADLLRAIAFVESSGNPSAVGRNASSEDYGLMQINSGWLNDACFNVQVGAEILADNFTRAAHPWDAVGAYNAACTRLKGQDCIDARQRYAWKVYRAYIGMSDAKRQKLRDVTS